MDKSLLKQCDGCCPERPHWPELEIHTIQSMPCHEVIIMFRTQPSTGFYCSTTHRHTHNHKCMDTLTHTHSHWTFSIERQVVTPDPPSTTAWWVTAESGVEWRAFPDFRKVCVILYILSSPHLYAQPLNASLHVIWNKEMCSLPPSLSLPLMLTAHPLDGACEKGMYMA
jgi:hypothetical protein